MSSVRSAVALGLIASSAAFTGSALPMTKAPGHALASQRPPALRQFRAANLKVRKTVRVRACVRACVRVR